MKKIAISLESIEPLFEKMGKLSKVQRLLISIGVLVLLIGAFVFLSFSPKHTEAAKLTKDYQKLEKGLKAAQRAARQQKMFQNKMKAAQVRFEIAKKALPEKKDIPRLLSDISSSGKDAGLEFLLFRPLPEAPKAFFAEIPIQMEVSGPFHNVAVFFDKISKLSRIVNIKAIEMTSGDNYSRLNTACTAVTYRFVEAPPPKPKPPTFTKKRPKKGKKKK